MYRVRIPIAIALLASIAGILYLDVALATDLGSVGLLALLTIGALVEFCRLLGLSRGATALGALFGLGYIAARYVEAAGIDFGGGGIDVTDVVLFAFALLAFAPALLAPDPRSDGAPPSPGLGPGRLRDLAIGLTGFFYVPYLLTFLIQIRFLRLPGRDGATGHVDGLLLVVFVALSAKAGDMGGYLIGKKFGKTKILPRISPKKSVEGTLAGLALGAVVGVLMWRYFPAVHLLLDPLGAALFGAGMALLSLLGDLVESSIKRRVGVKDSARLIPAFGGFLDLMDSLMFASPAGYYLLHFLLHRSIAS